MKNSVRRVLEDSYPEFSQEQYQLLEDFYAEVTSLDNKTLVVEHNNIFFDYSRDINNRILSAKSWLTFNTLVERMDKGAPEHG